MDNYELNLRNKLQYIISVISFYGVIKLPLNYFDVSVVSSEGELNRNNKIHGYGTQYKMRNLLAMYPNIVKELLDPCNIVFTKGKKDYTFSWKSPTGSITK